MVALPEVKNVEDCASVGGGSLPLIPAGQYQAIIVNSELVETKAKTGHYLALTVVITHGEYQHTEFIERLNIINSNAKAVEIAYGVLASISKALNMPQTPKDSVELHNKPLMIEVKTKAGEEWIDNNGVKQEGKDKSVIGKFLPLPSTGVPTATAAQPAAQPSDTPAAANPPASNPFAA